MKILSKEKLSQNKLKDNNGYLICLNCVLARTGEQQYRKNEVFATDDISEINIDRPYEEVFDNRTLASFENVPLCKDHPEEDVTPENHNAYSVGFVRNIRQGKDNNIDVIIGDLVITDSEVIELVENGEYCELSCGYNTDIVGNDSSGYKQTNIRGNHVALCQCGRAGNARIIDSILLDSKDFDKMSLDELKKTRDELSKLEKKLRDYNIYSNELDNKQKELQKIIDKKLFEDSINSIKDEFYYEVQYEDKFGRWQSKKFNTKQEMRNFINSLDEKTNIELYTITNGERNKAEYYDAISDKLIESSSEEAFKKNIATEIKSGKDPKQAAAIAYSIQRENDSEIKDIDINRIKEILSNYNNYISKLKTLNHLKQQNEHKLIELQYKLNSYQKYNNQHDYARSSDNIIKNLEKEIENLKFIINENEQDIVALESMLKEANEAKKNLDSLASTNEEVTKKLEKNFENFKEEKMKDSFTILHPNKYEFLSIGGRSWVKEDSNMIQYFESENAAKIFGDKYIGGQYRIMKINDSIKDSLDQTEIEVIEDAIYWLKKEGKEITVNNILKQINKDMAGFLGANQGRIVNYLKSEKHIKDSKPDLIKLFKLAKVAKDSINK